MNYVIGIVFIFIIARLILYILGMFVPAKTVKYRPIINAPATIKIVVPKQTVHSLHIAELVKKYPVLNNYVLDGYKIESIEPFVMSRIDSIGSLL